MNTRRLLNIFIIIIMGMILINPAVFAADPAEQINIESMVIKETFAPGNGSAVGIIRQVSDRVVIVHQAQKYGYRAEKGLDLFKGDIILTGKDGNVSFKLNDGSFISLASDTEMTINKSLYAPKQKTRSSFMEMVSGTARFVVRKFVDARHSEFKVKTRTAVAGVRGSDFIVDASETVTEITALEKTELAVISLSDPEADPIILHDFEQTTVRMGMLPEEAQKVKSDEVDRRMKEFRFLPSNPSPNKQSFTGASVPVSQENVHVDEKDLIAPNFDEIHQTSAPENLLKDKVRSKRILKDMVRSKKILMDEHTIEEQNIRIYEEKSEDFQRHHPLADFPGPPDKTPTVQDPGVLLLED